MYIQAKLVNGEVIEQFVDSNICVIGRSSKCDIVIPHEGMSRQHCQIEIIDGEYFVTDLGSTNGVLIDSQRIEPHQKIPYQTFLTLSFGAVQNLQIDEEVTAETAKDKASGAPIMDSPTASGLTRTKSMREPPRPATPSASSITKPNLKVEKVAKIRLWISAALGIILIMAAIAWYALQDDETPSEVFDIKNTKEIQEKAYDQF